MILVLCSPALLFSAQRICHLDLPDWVTAESSTFLEGGNQEVHVKQSLTLDGWSSGKLQSDLALAIENYIPFKSSALLGNAFFQRQAIAVSNALFQYEAFPTFFGSEGLYIPEVDALAKHPTAPLSQYTDGLRKTARGLSAFAQRHPDITFCLVLADPSNFSEANPAGTLVSKRLTTQECASILETELADASNVHVVPVAYDNVSDLYANYYRTDHHWNGYGAISAYDAVKEIAGLDDVKLASEDPLVFADFPCNGSYSREFLCLLNEEQIEPNIDVDMYGEHSEGAPFIISNDPVASLKSAGEWGQFDFYAQWFGSAVMTAKRPLSNGMIEDDSRAVIIQDSYNDALHWLLAQNYSYTQSYSDIKYPRYDQATLIDRLEEVDPDIVYFVGDAGDYTWLLDVVPNYFEE